MLRKHRKTTARVTLIGIVALLAAQGAVGQEPEPLKATGTLSEIYETDEGEEILVLQTAEATLELYLDSATEVWYGEAQASSDMLWEEFDGKIEVEVEYVVIDGRNVLEKVWILSEIEG